MLKLFKAKSLKNTNFLTLNRNKKTQEKDILKEGIGVNGKPTCTIGGRTRGFSFATHTPSKMSFAVSGSKKQKGRSMVEMLGVLAIIGVLSIGGIQGYTMAMRKYRANEVLNVIQKYAMIVYSNCQNAMLQNPKNYHIYYPININPDNLPPDMYTWECQEPIPFTDAGLGALPNGITRVGRDDNSPLSEPEDTTIKSLSSGDAVVFLVGFETKELCETVMGITGKPLYFEGDSSIGMKTDKNDLTCAERTVNAHKEYLLGVVTMMN